MAHRIFVGLSGGVDSAVAAALLKERGLDVVGVFVKIWQPEFTACTWKEDRLDAMRVAVRLGIPFRELDLSQEYKQEVVNRMVKDYERGITPNPDAICNTHIKFGALAAWAQAQGADALATGHYARVRDAGGRKELLRGVDAAKDQSYFLYGIERRELTRALFPVGELTKAQVRAQAKRFSLPVANKPDSQGLCFVGDVTLADFLSHYMELVPGKVLDRQGRIVGSHDGAALYTVGQRHGFEITHHTLRAKPCFVVAINTKDNTIVVSPDSMHAAREEIALTQEHWLVGVPHLPMQISLQTRYREKPVQAQLIRVGDDLHVKPEQPHVVAPGQAAVFYDDDLVLGGALIER